MTELDPRKDTKFETLCEWIDTHLRTETSEWLNDERLVVFTEYKTTLDWLRERFAQLPESNTRIMTLYGGMDDKEREALKAALKGMLGAERSSRTSRMNCASNALYWSYPPGPSRWG